MENKVDLQHNKIIHFENSMVMYGIYNSETLEKLVDTVHKMHNTTTWNETLFASKLDSWYNYYLSNNGIGHHATNSLLYLRTLREKYIKMYEEISSQLCMHEKAIRILSKDYLPISLLPPSTLQEIFRQSQKDHSDYKPRIQYSYKETASIV